MSIYRGDQKWRRGIGGSLEDEIRPLLISVYLRYPRLQYSDNRYFQPDSHLIFKITSVSELESKRRLKTYKLVRHIPTH